MTLDPVPNGRAGAMRGNGKSHARKLGPGTESDICANANDGSAVTISRAWGQRATYEP